MRAARRFALLAALAAVAACAETDEESAPRAPTPAAWELVAAPEWVRDFCRDADRVIRRPFLCPKRVPAGFAATSNLAVFRPLRRGYLLEAEAEAHWVLGALQRDELRDFGPPEPVGRMRVRGRPGRLLLAGEEGGILAGHLILWWREGGFDYAVSVHSGAAPRKVLRDRLKEVAAALTTY